MIGGRMQDRDNAVTLANCAAIELEMILEAALADCARSQQWYREQGGRNAGLAGIGMAMDSCSTRQRLARSILDKLETADAGRDTRDLILSDSECIEAEMLLEDAVRTEDERAKNMDGQRRQAAANALRSLIEARMREPLWQTPEAGT